MDSDSVHIKEETDRSGNTSLSKLPSRSDKTIRYLLPVLYLVADILGIYASFLIAFWFRFSTGFVKIFPLWYGKPPILFYINALIIVSAIWVFIFTLFGHYKRRWPSLFDRFYETIKGVIAGTFIILAMSFFYRGGSYSRIMLGIGCIISIFLIWLLRETVYKLEKWYLIKGVISNRAIFVGNAERGLDLYKKLSAQAAWGIRPIGFVCDEDISFPCLGKISELDEVIRSNSIDLVIFNLPQNGHDFITDFIMKSENLKIEYMISPDIIGLMTFNSEAGQIEGIPILRWGKTPIEGYSRGVKRAFDAVFSGIGLIIISPILLGLAIAVKLDSKGPIFFRQRRIGRNGRQFTIYKFRSMRVDQSSVDGTGWTVKDDPRRTKVGIFIRKYNLDELPQLLNVFMGQMSLVGPRPEQPGYVEKFKDDIPRYFQRHRVKSGVTGWAQVNGFRGDTSITERTKYDLYYVENWSLIFDIKIIFLTIKNMLKSPNAY
jgi:exopolysaccharide biosynthesis polyprenyl glycosylphosphotransferase